MKNVKLDNDEQQLLTSIEKEEWQSVDNLSEEIYRMKQYAKNTIEKVQNVAIDIPEKDIKNLKRKSIEIGIPVETLLQVLIHTYASGKMQINF